MPWLPSALVGSTDGLVAGWQRRRHRPRTAPRASGQRLCATAMSRPVHRRGGHCVAVVWLRLLCVAGGLTAAWSGGGWNSTHTHGCCFLWSSAAPTAGRSATATPPTTIGGRPAVALLGCPPAAPTPSPAGGHPAPASTVAGRAAGGVPATAGAMAITGMLRGKGGDAVRARACGWGWWWWRLPPRRAGGGHRVGRGRRTHPVRAATAPPP